MCTGISTRGINHYFGRSLDVSVDFPFKIIVTPRNYSFSFIPKEPKNNYALIGMGIIEDDYPLYFDAINEEGVAMAGLNFPGYAYYAKKENPEKINLAPFELIQFLLRQVSSVKEAYELLQNIELVDKTFNSKMPNAPLHWLISDGKESLVVERTKEGLQIYENPFHILTNNPPFAYHCFNVENYLHLTPHYPKNHFSKNISLKPNSIGLGALGLPGDNSSPSRFVRGFYHLDQLELTESETDNVLSFFHVLDSVIQVKGASFDASGQSEFSAYFSCMSAKTKTYYVKLYENSQIQSVSLKKEFLNKNHLLAYNLEKKTKILRLN